MRILSLSLKNFRSYQEVKELQLGRINLFVGANNAGKSTLLRAAHLLQQGHNIGRREVRVEENRFEVQMELEDFVPIDQSVRHERLRMTTTLTTNAARDSETREQYWTERAAKYSYPEFPAKEPHHLIVPLYSQRKTRTYGEQTNSVSVKDVSDNFASLTAKLARLANPNYPGHELYKKLCTQVLGWPVFTTDSDNGHMVGTYVGESIINVTSMGDGVPHIAGMLAALVNAKDKVFLIEEPENDLHPAALKVILDLIVERSKDNQFFITTHSNIVVRHLGAETGSKLFQVRTQPNERVPTSYVEPVADTTQARIDVLSDMGYALSDFELSEGWLILEESSAEVIIREFLIPMFTPSLASLQTVTAGGIGKVRPTFDDFRRLALYGHLQQAYQSKTWVRVDGDDVGQTTVAQLQSSYKDWPTDRFGTFTQAQFERYYPNVFQQQASDVLAIGDRQKKREAKRELLQEVLKWLREDRTRAQTALEISASDVIEDLRGIAAQL